MEWAFALVLLLGLLVTVMLSGVPVAFSFLAVNALGAYLFLGGEIGFGQIVRNALQAVLNYSLAPIPLFILIGELMVHSGLAFRALDAIDKLISRVPGRMPIVALTAGTAFSALSGSSLANTSMLGSTLLPNMLKRGYHPIVAIGPIVAVGGLAVLIPPSGLAVLMGSLAKISISAMLIGGIVPGLIMAALFVGYIVFRAVYSPQWMPADDGFEKLSLLERLGPFLRDVVPLFLIFVAIVGSLLGGIATPTESAALGVAATLIIAALYKRLSPSALLTAILETGKVSGMIFFIAAASITFSQVLAFSGAASGLLRAIEALSLTPLMIILVIAAVLLFLGCFIDQVSMMMITIPFFIPLAAGANIDLVWVGIIYLICLEIGMITPPFGLLLFVMKGVAPPQVTMGIIIRAILPFLSIKLFVLGLVILIPLLVTGLPAMLLGR